ncbi:hypothetical protein PHAMO_420016 [Magnetospirillum molischianum DSM 120]|uniref:Uncharacterized protein n=1 Tax=Magnetospirillum molischianum DSM 120 TaxID=1150626 RepID=H8FWJ6_MAGML|nr:hypothetical protein PHAMO_420016 [Magnetospirillum molischianum DSM 120]
MATLAMALERLAVGDSSVRLDPGNGVSVETVLREIKAV